MGHFPPQPSFDGAATGGAVFDRRGRFLSVNDRYSEITGYSRDELLALDAQRITHPDDLPGTLHAASRLLIGELRTAVIEKRYVRKDGGVRWVRNSATLGAPDADGRPTFLVITEDIHVWREARQLAAACLDEQDAGAVCIASHLHDGAAQMLSALSMELALVATPAPAADTARLVDDAIELAAQTTREIRTVIYLLHPGLSPGEPLGPSLQALVAGFSHRSGIPVAARIGKLPSLSAPITSTLVRIVREWLFHLRWSPREPGLAISLQGCDGGIHLELMNSSGGGDRVPTVRSRIEWFGGRSDVASGPSGTNLSIWLPAGESDAAPASHPILPLSI